MLQLKTPTLKKHQEPSKLAAMRICVFWSPGRCLLGLVLGALATITYNSYFLAIRTDSRTYVDSQRNDTLSLLGTLQPRGSTAKSPFRGVFATSSLSRIPYILHQTWINERIPTTYVSFVQSWKTHQPPLSYYYWTDESSLRFVAKHYPTLLSTFKGYKAHLNRADAIRYMLLHHYGGVYADMDMMLLKNLSPLLNKTNELCYLSQERFEITRLYWGLDSSVMNAIMLSAPGHRFMEFVVNSLQKYAHHSPNVMESTGPFFLQNVFNDYNKTPPCNLSSPMCRCVAADPFVFIPQIDPIRIPLFRRKCRVRRKLKPNQQEACGMMDKVRWRNELEAIGSNAYTHHGFLHYGFEDQKIRFNSMTNIDSIRPEKNVFI